MFILFTGRKRTFVSSDNFLSAASFGRLLIRRAAINAHAVYSSSTGAGDAGAVGAVVCVVIAVARRSNESAE